MASHSDNPHDKANDIPTELADLVEAIRKLPAETRNQVETALERWSTTPVGGDAF